ncbi:hypothetical protein ACWEV4_09605 [Streptomyces sp. NPDC003860]
MNVPRMTRFGRGGGCACKIPSGELETLLSGLTDRAATDEGDVRAGGGAGAAAGAGGDCPATR